jgi:toxoflavin synthase
MSSVYDTIAEDFKRSRMLPFRRHVEAYTYLTMIGPLTGKAVLDLACGEGAYSREARRLGAARVIGVDQSEAMIALARQEEARVPLGVEYMVEDVTRLGRIGEFDLVIASYLLNYARTRAQLDEMCAAIAANLRSGGRFVTINNNPEQAIETFDRLSKYGFTKRASTSSLREGSPITITMLLEGREIAFENYYLSIECHERALRSAGFHAVRWQPPLLGPEAAREDGEEFWRDFLDCRPIIALEATR